MSEISRQRSDEIAGVAHDLRAPLAVASGYLAMLRDGTFGDAPARWGQPLEVLAFKLEEARLIVEDLLSLDRVGHGVDDTALGVLDLAEVAHAAVRSAEPRAHLLTGTVELEPTGAHQVLALGDQRRTLRILDNLINNALLHSGAQSKVVVRVGHDPMPQVAVEDSGPGVPDSLRDRIFERFTRDDASEQVGSGLGLFLSRTLAEQMHGELVLEERGVEPGSRFVLRLPAPDSSLAFDRSTP